MDRSVINNCLVRIMRPLMRFCVRHGMQIQPVTEAVKINLIAAAVEEIERRGELVSMARISAITGIHRRDVRRLHDLGDIKSFQSSLITRVIGQWQQNREFLTKNGSPRVLSFEGGESDFRELMRYVATDLDAGVVLHEMRRLGLVEQSSRGIKLKSRAYIASSDPEETFDLLAEDVEDLLCALEENLFRYANRPHLHAKTEYDNISVEDIPKIQRWILEEGSRYHKRARQFLSQLDLDFRRGAGRKGGVRVAIGSFSRISTEEFADQLEEKLKKI